MRQSQRVHRPLKCMKASRMNIYGPGLATLATAVYVNAGVAWYK